MKWLVYAIGVIVCMQVVAGNDVCDPFEEDCKEIPEPVKTGVEAVIFPIRPILDIVSAVVKKFHFILKPIGWILGIVTSPLRLIRWVLYLPMHVILSPIRIGSSILGGLWNALGKLIAIPKKIISIPIHVLISPIVAIKSLIKLPIRVIELLVRFLQDPNKALLSVISDIINIPYLHFIPPLAGIWAILIPVGMIFKYLFC